MHGIHAILWTMCLAGAAVMLHGCGGATPDAPVLMRLQVTPESTGLAAGRTVQFKAWFVYSDGSTRDVGAEASWSSSQPSVAAVGERGWVTAHREGTAEIRADLPQASGAAQFIVTSPVAEGIRVGPSDRVLASGTGAQYAAYATLSDGSEQDVTQAAEWRSTNTAVVVVENIDSQATSKGNVDAQEPGTADVIAEYQGVQGSTAVTVVPAVVYGGGDVVAAIAYVGTGWFNAAEPGASRRLSDHRNPPARDSLFGNLESGLLVSYCQTGDDLGKRVFDGVNGARADGACGRYAEQPEGFNGIAAARPSFAAAELPLTAQEYLRTQDLRAANPTQVPALAASIAIAYNHPRLSGLSLTTAQLREIFSGAVTNWRQIDPELPEDEIVVVYRGDHSAATFALANHLSCTPIMDPDTGRRWCGGDPLFRTTPWFPEMTGSVPLHWVAAGTNADAGALVLLTPYSIGYGEAADLRLRHPGLRFARVNNVDPLATGQPHISATLHTPTGVFPNECTIAGFAPAGGAAVNGPRNVNREPLPEDPTPNDEATLASCSGEDMAIAPGRPILRRPEEQNTAHNPCALLVDPDAYADPLARTPYDPPVYPILSLSYFLAYTSGNFQSAPGIREVLLSPYGDIALQPGFARLSGYAPSAELIESCVY